MKKHVNEELFNNMKRYMSPAQMEKYEVCSGESDAAVIEYVREYYNKILPIDVFAWRQVNHFLNCDEQIEEQIEFITKHICGIFYANASNDRVKVMDTHIANDEAIFPIFKIDFALIFGLEIVAACTDEEWIVSFATKSKIAELECKYHFDLEKACNSVEEEHLPKEKVYPAFKENTDKFTAKFKSKYEFYAFCVYMKEELSFE